MTKIGPMPDAFKEHFGEDAEKTQRDAAALASLASIHAMYCLSEDGSKLDAFSEDALTAAVEKVANIPEKSADLIAVALQLIFHLRTGGTYLDFFQKMGIEPIPLSNGKGDVV